MIAISLQFVFGCVVSFLGGFQCPFVAGCSTASCDFGALAGGDEHTSFYSAILNQKPTKFLFLFYFLNFNYFCYLLFYFLKNSFRLVTILLLSQVLFF